MPCDNAPETYICPGFVDAHIHIESSMLLPAAFAHKAVQHGTIATISDPHEIANVCGIEGVQYMIDNSKKAPLKIFFGAPSCVPATSFETAGATLNAADTAQMLSNKDIWYLSEMMNYPGVLFNDSEVMAKIAAAQNVGKPVDGHAPGLRGADAQKYCSAGITTDHECFTLEEAEEKIALGMHILIREGSAAKNYNALHPLIAKHPEKVMFCSDDKHPDELMLHHINETVKRSLKLGYDLFDVLRIASCNPINHYKVPVGQLRVGDPADFLIINNTTDFQVRENWINGTCVFSKGETHFEIPTEQAINSFKVQPLDVTQFKVFSNQNTTSINVIEAIEGQLITNKIAATPLVKNGEIVSDTENDILKIVVVNRYTPNPTPAVAFIKNFGLKHGAIASTVGHDCHNIICVGVDDDAICKAVNLLIAHQGGISVVGNQNKVLPLPVAGLMSLERCETVGSLYAEVDAEAKALGCTLHAPFMTLSFMALLVIPSLKLSDLGLFDGSAFKFVDVQA